MNTEAAGTTEQQETIKSKDVAGQFSFSVKLDQSNDKTLNITGFLYAGDTLEECQERIDMFDALVSRQTTRSSIPLMEADLEQRLKHLEGYIKHVQGLQEQRDVLKGKPRTQWSSTEKKQFQDSQEVIDKYATSLQAMQDDIENRRKAIANAKEKVA